ncbi:MAG: tetratricopeptide repeat protein, partial [Nanoarchaeota archaeon]|nr:tetratricopeptide repeat protein [Nanoarchaeota archaeon]
IADKDLKDQKEKHKNHSGRFCWVSKTYFLKYLMLIKELEKIVYLDADISCFNDPSELFEKELVENNICLTPHYFSSSLKHLEETCGKYNAGFIGVNSNAIAFLNWWQSCCYQKCESDPTVRPVEGRIEDQGYLDNVPLLFKRVKNLGRKYNLGPWNTEGIVFKDNKFGVDGKPLVFFHFHQLKIANWRVIDRNSSPTYDISRVMAVYDRFDQLLHQAAKKYDVFPEKEKLNEPLDIFHSTLGLGNLYLNQGKLEEAEEKYKKGLAIERLPDEVRHHILLGFARLFVRKGEPEKAEEKFKEALSLKEVQNQTRFHAILGLANCYLSQGKHEEAEEKFNEALSINEVPEPEKIFAHYSLGSIYERKGDYKKAKDKFETVLTLTKDIESLDGKLLGNAHFHLGCIYQSLGEREKAEREFEDCLKLILDHKKAKENLKKIRAINRDF